MHLADDCNKTELHVAATALSIASISKIAVPDAKASDGGRWCPDLIDLVAPRPLRRSQRPLRLKSLALAQEESKTLTAKIAEGIRKGRKANPVRQPCEIYPPISFNTALQRSHTVG